jgi:dTDP-4-amino-4,6-dideoxygalactose transaminase
MSRIALSKSHLSGHELPYIKEAFSKNQASVHGENLSGFENDLDKYLQEGVHSMCTTSGTAAVHLALILAGVVQNDEVLCQSFTFVATANPIVYQGANPIFIDSEKDTWNMCPNYLEKAILDRISKGKKPKAIIVVHLYGMPAKMDEISAISKKYDIILIEDAAEALGSVYKGQKCGTFGDFGILSFNGNKIITASGGGALVCKSKEDKERAIFLATQSRDDVLHYQHSEIGYNYQMSNVLGGIGRGQMIVLDKYVTLRRENNLFYQNFFNKTEGVSVFKEHGLGFFSNHWLSCILIDENVTDFTCGDMHLHLDRDNIESRRLWKPMHLQPVFKDYDYYGGTIAQELFETGLCLPSGSNLTGEDKLRIANSISKLMK